MSPLPLLHDRMWPLQAHGWTGLGFVSRVRVQNSCMRTRAAVASQTVATAGARVDRARV